MLVTAAMCAILWRWMRPLWRDLQSLTGAAARMGEGNFGARAEVGRGSLLEPIASAFNVMAERVRALLQSHRDLDARKME